MGDRATKSPRREPGDSGLRTIPRAMCVGVSQQERGAFEHG